MKVLPLGDSITSDQVNNEGNAGYGEKMFAVCVGRGQSGEKITFTRSLSNGPSTVSGQTFPRRQRSPAAGASPGSLPHSGGNAGIATVIPSPALNSGSGGVPNIILLHIGTNDQGSFTATQMTSGMAAGLLDKIIANAPDALLVVSQISPLGYRIQRRHQDLQPGTPWPRANAPPLASTSLWWICTPSFNTSTMLGSDAIHPNSYQLQVHGRPLVLRHPGRCYPSRGRGRIDTPGEARVRSPPSHAFRNSAAAFTSSLGTLPPPRRCERPVGARAAGAPGRPRPRSPLAAPA